MTAHALPEVTKAVSEQAGRIIHTSTLYLNRPMVELAEQIATVSAIPDAKVFFTTSGTEANDTALLLAVVAAALQPDPGAAQQLPRPLLLDDRASPATGLVARRRSRRSRPTTCTAASSTASRSRAFATASSSRPASPTCATCSTRSGGDVAALIAEPIQGVGGFTSGPDGLLGAFAEVLREHGILWISDEVQTGWGRTGEHFWGWQAHGGGPPDIVTFAKGVGNGLSMGGVIARAEIMDCARRQLHLDVRRHPADLGRGAGQPALPARPRPAGQRRAAGAGPVRAGCARSTARIVGDVRGKGLMIGVELVRTGHRPAPPDIADRGAGGARSAGALLIGKGGLHGNALRIAPPLSLTRAEAEEGLAALVAAHRGGAP